MAEDSRDPPPMEDSFPRAAAIDIARALRFFSRLPVPALPFERDPHAMPDFSRMTRMLPVAGAIIALPGALVLIVALGLGLPPLPAATLAVAATLIASGGLHEDGLADCCDALGARGDRERRLAIMKDSAIGSFGAAGLVLVLIMRVSLFAAIAQGAGALAAATAMIASAGLSRWISLWLMVSLPAARESGASASAGRIRKSDFTVAGAIAGLLSLILLFPAGHGLGALGLAFALAGAIVWLCAVLARRLIGGQTGDVIGATQQLAEIAALSALLILIPA
ncbi:MAG: adenosylcobinamide-GDP ribazoletransferase [Salinarimonas sp.]|nr:adenosylcobinamide-GDP ribazoletransferase [Salinarimonas sp.]